MEFTFAFLGIQLCIDVESAALGRSGVRGSRIFIRDLEKPLHLQRRSVNKRAQRTRAKGEVWKLVMTAGAESLQA